MIGTLNCFRVSSYSIRVKSSFSNSPFLIDSNNGAKDIVLEVNDVYGKTIPVFPIEIPLSVRAAEGSAVAKRIYDYDPKGKAAFAYMSLTKEVCQLPVVS